MDGGKEPPERSATRVAARVASRTPTDERRDKGVKKGAQTAAASAVHLRPCKGSIQLGRLDVRDLHTLPPEIVIASARMTAIKQISLRLERDLLEQIEEARHGIPRERWIREALLDAIDRKYDPHLAGRQAVEAFDDMAREWDQLRKAFTRQLEENERKLKGLEVLDRMNDLTAWAEEEDGALLRAVRDRIDKRFDLFKVQTKTKETK